jgi:hypothetical protein
MREEPRTFWLRAIADFVGDCLMAACVMAAIALEA